MATDSPWAEPDSWKLRIVDLTLAGVSIALAASLTAESLAQPEYESVPPRPALALAVLHGGVLLWRRRQPDVVHAVVVASGFAYVLLGLPSYFLGIAILVSTNTVAVQCDRRRSLAWLAVAEAGLLAGSFITGFRWDPFLPYAGLVAGAWLLGAGNRRLRIHAYEERQRADELDRARHELARMALTTERLRIARELHDVLAHGMTMIAVQAGTGRMVIDNDPASAKSSLRTIEVTARRAVDEMRHLLDALRQDGETDTSLAPAPGIQDLHALIAEFAESGLIVELQMEGDAKAVPPGPALAVYRIVQEGLTNVFKHAGPVKATVLVHLHRDGLDVQIVNEPALGPPPPGCIHGGQGSIGMRERASLYGGTCEIGPTPDGGWEVSARVPVGSSRVRTAP